MDSATTLPDTKPPAPIERTEHPHVVKSADAMGGEPRIDGTRMPVRQLYNLVEAGTSVAEISETWPWLTRSHVHDALSYAYEHPEEMAYHEERHKIRNVMRDHDLVLVNHRLIPRDQPEVLKLPPDAVVYDWQSLPKELEE
jgi:uncharacterized protein (DUF433 family)